MCSHVDDFVCAGSQRFHSKVISEIRSQFHLSRESEGNILYTGIEISQFENEIHMHQYEYINSIQPLKLRMSSDHPLDITEKRSLKSLIGQLQWAAKLTRPDLSFASCDLSTRCKDATTTDVKHANKQLRKLQSDAYQLCIPGLNDIKNAQLIVYGDASHANPPMGASQGGFIVFLYGANKKASPLIWKSHKLKRVVHSAMDAETLSLQDGCYVVESFDHRG